jgi:predicted nucleic acid-binding protein
MDCFDADVLIYAANPADPMGAKVRALFDAAGDEAAGVGSTLLLAETLIKPTRQGKDDEALALAALIGRLELWAVDEGTANLAVALGADYGLKAVDALHLATAIAAGADRFITNNRRDFTTDIVEVDVTYPEDLPP